MATSSVDVAGTAIGPSAAYAYGTAKGDWSALTYSAGVEYDLLPDTMAYATYKTGYQPGSANYDAMAGTSMVSVKNTTDQITLGIKNKFFDNRLQVNAEAFQLRFKNRSFNDPISYTAIGSTDTCTATPGVSGLIVGSNLGCINPNQTTVIMPNQKSLGLDLDVNFLLTANDRVDAAFAYLDSTYGANPNAPAFTVAQLLTAAGITSPTAAQTQAVDNLLAGYNTLVTTYKGTILQNSPKYSGNLSYEHIFRFASGGTLAPKVAATSKDKYWAQGGGPVPAGYTSAVTALASGSLVRQDAYSLFDAYTTWSNADSKLSITGYVKILRTKQCKPISRVVV